MNGTEILYLVLFFLCLLLSAFFSSSETAFISLQKLRLRHLASLDTTDGDTAKKVLSIIKRPERLLTTILLGNNLVNTAAAALATAVAVSILTRGQAVLVATAGVTLLLLIFGEVFPKVAATRYGERLALFYVTPIKLLIVILSPVAMVFVWIVDKLARMVGAHPVLQPLTGEAEVHTAVSVGVEEGTITESEAEMLKKVFRFGDSRVTEVMTPRPDIKWLKKGTTLSEFLSSYAQAPHSRFPVYEETIDDVVGILWIKDVLMSQARGSLDQNSPIDELVRPVSFVPEFKPVAELFTELQESGGYLAVVIDEFGGVAGLVTLEQLVGEIVGELRDELAKGRKEFEAIGKDSFLIDGGMRIEDANEELGLQLPEGPYETVAGFVLNLLGYIPKEGEQIGYEKLRLTVTQMKGVKIEKVLVTKEYDAKATSNLQSG